MPQAAVIRGVTYIVDVTQPCKKKSHNTKQNSYTVYVSYSAANITVIARNAAGLSPPAVVHVPAASAPDLKSRSYRLCACMRQNMFISSRQPQMFSYLSLFAACDKTMLDKKLKNKTCLEFYELQDADLIPKRVWCLTSKNRTNKRKEINNCKLDIMVSALFFNITSIYVIFAILLFHDENDQIWLPRQRKHLFCFHYRHEELHTLPVL